jgi:hypothetical protein
VLKTLVEALQAEREIGAWLAAERSALADKPPVAQIAPLSTKES